MQKTRYKFSKLNQNKSLFQLLSSKGTIKLEQMNKIRRDIPTKIKINSDINKNINNNNNQINKMIDIKYKEIESKYKKEINKEMKDDTLFDEDIINNFDIKEEIIINNAEPIEVVSNMASQTLKPKKKNKNNINDQSLNMSQEKDFQIIESYCLLSGQKDESINNGGIQNNFNKDNVLKEDESKSENNQVEELHNHVKKILDEFN